MGFFQALSEFFESIFMSSSPEVKKKMELRKIENELKSLPIQIFKNGQLQPNFAELFRILYENTKPIDEILSATVNTGDANRNANFENQLVMTGFTVQTQEKLELLNYENRKKAVIDSDLSINKVLEAQKHSLESIMKQISTPDFFRIDETLSKIRQLCDVCRFNYVNVIKAFDKEFDGITSIAFGNVNPVNPDLVSSFIEDLYFVSGSFKVDSAEVRAILALKQLVTGQIPDEAQVSSISRNLKKINSVFTGYLTSDTLKKIICIGKKDASYTPKSETYRSNSLKKFIEFFQTKFASDSERIKSEIKDYTVSFELKALFGDKPFAEIKGYNNETNEFLRTNTPYSFVWITPLQVIKTFVRDFLSEPVMSVLNNVVIEGFFNNSNYKSDFSASVFACNEILKLIENFEHSFSRGEPNDEAELRGLVLDSRRDSDFLKKVSSMVDNINDQAHRIVQEETKNLYGLYKQIGELLVDSKKSKSDMISNIKVLLTSSRNRDGSGLLEQQYDDWETFLKIMKNYAIVGEIGSDHD